MKNYSCKFIIKIEYFNGSLPYICKLRFFDVMRTSKDVDRGWSWVVALSLFSIYALSYGFAWTTGLNRSEQGGRLDDMLDRAPLGI